ncbi:MAG: nickel pincer cofactor biosynthesis protein LarC [Gammaproteobacteria bacterium]|nr:nickel pincer cofactor biosynthesis protein LarC [Gammaproteobacteria bacterium]MYD81207.1 nickel pincer cofactor biosynthesis protein LarC [Gammaproteobacteria bacterium]
MQLLLYECFSGIAGDMNLGALIDVGVPEEHLRSELSQLNLEGEYQLTVSRGSKQGISGTLATVSCRPSNAHRHFPDIRRMIESSELSDSVARRSVQIFENLAEAEARVHNISRDEVHFHEVGAIDAIVDIVGASICLEYLKPDSIACGPIELGSGMVKCEHGLMPVPAPATAELLLDRPTTRGRVDGEATTPTGAAILSATVDSFEVPNNLRVKRIGYGLGQKDFEVPNVLRVSLAQMEPELAYESNMEIECNIDDMTPEAIGTLFEQLLEEGALDVFVTPILMKKSRPAHRITVLARQDKAEHLIGSVLRGTTTLGVRTHSVTKHMVPRQILNVQTRYGSVRVKIAKLSSSETKWKVEHEDLARLAREEGLQYLEVKRKIEEDVRTELSQSE